MNSWYFTGLLADNVTGQAKEVKTHTSFFEIPEDTTGAPAKEERVKQNLKAYRISRTVREEFNRLKRIVTGARHLKTIPNRI